MSDEHNDEPRAAGSCLDQREQPSGDNVRCFALRVQRDRPRLRRISLADLTRVASLVAQHLD